MWRFDSIRQEIHVALYHPKDNDTEYVRMTRKNAHELSRASCHLPFFSDFPGKEKGVRVDHNTYCDGGTRHIFPASLVQETYGYDNLLFIANFPYQWIPDEIPWWMRRLAALYYGAQAPYLDQALHMRSQHFIEARRSMSKAVRRGLVNFLVLGPKRALERYPVSHCGSRSEIKATLIAGEVLARKDEKTFHAWVNAVKGIATSRTW